VEIIKRRYLSDSVLVLLSRSLSVTHQAEPHTARPRFPRRDFVSGQSTGKRLYCNRYAWVMYDQGQRISGSCVICIIHSHVVMSLLQQINIQGRSIPLAHFNLPLNIASSGMTRDRLRQHHTPMFVDVKRNARARDQPTRWIRRGCCCATSGARSQSLWPVPHA
jgi:hypothetical protein